MKCVLAGYGEIGKAVVEVYGAMHDILVVDDAKGMTVEAHNTDVLLIAIPFDRYFVQTAQDYQAMFNPIATIIFSTVSIGTTEQIQEAVHSPVEGRHPNLAESMRIMPRWVGGHNETALAFFNGLHKQIKCVPDSKFTEFMKLSSTSLYGVNLEFARYRKQVADSLGMDYNYIKDFDSDYNELYLELGLAQFQRYILGPPSGNLGGHCIVPNSRILDAQFPNDMLKEIYREKE